MVVECMDTAPRTRTELIIGIKMYFGETWSENITVIVKSTILKIFPKSNIIQWKSNRSLNKNLF